MSLFPFLSYARRENRTFLGSMLFLNQVLRIEFQLKFKFNNIERVYYGRVQMVPE